jgi:3-oxoacyl-[acyl-carrier-protein] synthase II
MNRRRVAITGIGLLAAVGTDRESVWNSLLAGRCGIGLPAVFDTTGYRSRLAAEIPDYGADRRFSPLDRRRLSRSDQIAFIAAEEALGDAGLAGRVAPERLGVVLGAGTADLRRNEEYVRILRQRGIDRAPPSLIFNHFSSTPVDVIGDRLGCHGPRSCIVGACSSSTIAVGHAGDLIRSGQADVVLAGGADVLCHLTVSGFNALRLVDRQPCRPFDAGRAGMNIGEAAAILVLEDLDTARRRGASIYAELRSYAAGCEGFHPTSPEPTGEVIASTIGRALALAELDPSGIDHVNAHGTATPHNDRAEARALHRVFGPRAAEMPVTSIKSMVGHCLGAAGGIEAAALALTIARGVIPPTIHHDTTDPECRLDVVANTAREQPVRHGVSTSLAFGGNDSAIVMSAVT